MSDLAPDFLGALSARTKLAPPLQAPSRLKSRIYSALMRAESRQGSLASLSACKSEGGTLCAWEELVQIAPVGRRIKSLNLCTFCHARVLGEHVENPPIYWKGCPYAEFGKA